MRLTCPTRTKSSERGKQRGYNDGDVAMPQVYWVGNSANDPGDAQINLAESYGEYKTLFPDKPYVGTGLIRSL